MPDVLLSHLPPDPRELATGSRLANGSSATISIKDLTQRHRGEVRELSSSAYWAPWEGKEPAIACHPQLRGLIMQRQPASGGSEPASDSLWRQRGGLWLQHTALHEGGEGLQPHGPLCWPWSRLHCRRVVQILFALPPYSAPPEATPQRQDQKAKFHNSYHVLFFRTLAGYTKHLILAVTSQSDGPDGASLWRQRAGR